MPAIVVDVRRLPLDIEANATFGIETKTTIKPSVGGIEARYSKQRPRVTATCATGPSTVAEVIDLYREQVGPRWAFTVFDNVDNTAVDEVLLPDGSGKYQLTKTYGTVRPNVRNIILPDLTNLVVKKDGVTKTIVTDYNIAYGDYGLITPTTSWAASLITWSGGFFCPMRFADDNIDFSTLAKGVVKVQPFKLIEELG
jgi:uncharacterized protein (TIGR02217 family)